MIVVRDAVPADADAIARVELASWRAARRTLAPESVLHQRRIADAHRNVWEAWHFPPGVEVLVATDAAGLVVGVAMVGPEREPDNPIGEPRGEVYGVDADPAASDAAAIGDALVREARRRLAARGHRVAVWWVLADSPTAREVAAADEWAWTGQTAWYEQVGDELLASVELTHRLP